MTIPTLPLDYNLFRKAIANELTRISGIVTIMSEPETQRTPRPKKPYYTMKFMSPGVKQGSDSVNRQETSSVVNIGGQRKLTCSFQCYGRSHEEAYNFMVLWQAHLETETTQANLRLAGIALWLNGSVEDLSALLNTGYEGRAGMDVQFGIASNLSEDQGEIDTVIIQGTVTSDQNIPTTVSVTVTN